MTHNGNLATNLIIIRKGYITSKSSLWSCWKRPQLYVSCASCRPHVQSLDLGLKKSYIFSFLLLLLIEVLFLFVSRKQKKRKEEESTQDKKLWQKSHGLLAYFKVNANLRRTIGKNYISLHLSFFFFEKSQTTIAQESTGRWAQMFNLITFLKKSFPWEELEMSMKAKPAMRAVTAETVGSGDLMIMRCNDVL